ncbi:hypothetical protein DK59_3183 [Brucella abortus bv. 4 str. 292]|nr:hypothetical protein DK59_3183 [Brucella abortus bv. 4 str. 292]
MPPRTETLPVPLIVLPIVAGVPAAARMASTPLCAASAPVLIAPCTLPFVAPSPSCKVPPLIAVPPV